MSTDVKLFGTLPQNASEAQIEKLDHMLSKLFDTLGLTWLPPGNPVPPTAFNTYTYCQSLPENSFEIRYSCSKEKGLSLSCTSFSEQANVEEFLEQVQFCSYLLFEHVFPQTYLCYKEPPKTNPADKSQKTDPRINRNSIIELLEPHLTTLQEAFPEESFVHIVEFRSSTALWNQLRSQYDSDDDAMHIYRLTAFCMDSSVLADYVLHPNVQGEENHHFYQAPHSRSMLDAKLPAAEEDTLSMAFFTGTFLVTFLKKYNNLKETTDLQNALQCLHSLRNTNDSSAWEAFDFPPHFCSNLQNVDIEVLFTALAYGAKCSAASVRETAEKLFSMEAETARTQLLQYKHKALLRSICHRCKLKEDTFEQSARYTISYYLQNGVPALNVFEQYTKATLSHSLSLWEFLLQKTAEKCAEAKHPIPSSLYMELSEKMSMDTNVYSVVKMLHRTELSEKELDALLYLLDAPELRELRKFCFHF